MFTTKIKDDLRDLLDATEPKKEIEVIIELNPIQTAQSNQDRNQKIASIKKAFNDGLEPVANEISNHGGNILGSAWLNQTVKAKVPIESIEKIASLKEVNAIDLPRSITRD